MTIGDFVAKYLEPDLQVSAGGKANMSEDYKVAYIAQHALFDQLPALRKDFRTPPLCNLGPKGLQRVNAWIGSSGTVTPLHFDSYDNLLCQVLGFKYVRLYSQSENAYLYLDKQPADDVSYAQKNISPVSIENPDLSQHPDFERAVYTETLLGPGDMLFMPQGCWHYVRSLTPSMSVNFWF